MNACFNCKQVGHFAYSCPNQSGVGIRFSKPKAGCCAYCQSPNHRWADCPQLANSLTTDRDQTSAEARCPPADPISQQASTPHPSPAPLPHHHPISAFSPHTAMQSANGSAAPNPSQNPPPPHTSSSTHPVPYSVAHEGATPTAHSSSSSSASAPTTDYTRAPTSPIEGPTLSRCACEKLVTSANRWQSDFHQKVMALPGSQFVNTFWFRSPLSLSSSSVNTNLDPSGIAQFCIKPVCVFRPHVQFAIDLRTLNYHCPSVIRSPNGRQSPCKGHLKSDGWAPARYVHDICGGVYLLQGRYRCSKCGLACFATSSLFMASLPDYVVEEFPLHVFSQSAITKDLHSLIMSMVSRR